jgi:hypothetical protein
MALFDEPLWRSAAAGRLITQADRSTTATRPMSPCTAVPPHTGQRMGRSSTMPARSVATRKLSMGRAHSEQSSWTMYSYRVGGHAQRAPSRSAAEPAMVTAPQPGHTSR